MSIVIYAADLFLKLPFQEGESFVIIRGYNTLFNKNRFKGKPCLE